MIRTDIDWRACPIVEYDAEKLHGAPTIRGLRITPDAIVENFDDGLSVAEIHEQFPSVSPSDIQTVLAFAVGRGYVEGPIQ